VVDDNIDNPSNIDTVDCQKYYKEYLKQQKSTDKKSTYTQSIVDAKVSTQKRYLLSNYIV
jgi:hypothetical protein